MARFATPEEAEHAVMAQMAFSPQFAGLQPKVQAEINAVLERDKLRNEWDRTFRQIDFVQRTAARLRFRTAMMYGSNYEAVCYAGGMWK